MKGRKKVASTILCRSSETAKAAAGKMSAEIYRRDGDWKRIMRSRPSQSVLYRFAHAARRWCRFVQRSFPWRTLIIGLLILYVAYAWSKGRLDGYLPRALSSTQVLHHDQSPRR